jgi:hypothetical protein
MYLISAIEWFATAQNCAIESCIESSLDWRYPSGMIFRKAAGQKPFPECEICILAGGLSSRMGRNKAALRIGRRTLLGVVRDNARRLDLPVRVIRRDLVPRCGPLGGICPAPKTPRA